MSKYSQTPWSNWTEWKDIRDKLFSKEIELQKYALKRISAWKSRMNFLPLAVEATSQLVEISIHDSSYGIFPGDMYRSLTELSLQYSSIIIRTVNGLVDATQRGAYAVPVSSLAKQIGIPQWIVDVRHDSSHNKLPSISILRHAGVCLLDWLFINYWEKQSDILHAAGNKILVGVQNMMKDSSMEKALFTEIEVFNSVIPLLVYGMIDGEKFSNPILLPPLMDKEEISFSDHCKKISLTLHHFQTICPFFHLALLFHLLDVVNSSDISKERKFFCQWVEFILDHATVVEKIFTLEDSINPDIFLTETSMLKRIYHLLQVFKYHDDLVHLKEDLPKLYEIIESKLSLDQELDQITSFPCFTSFKSYSEHFELSTEFDSLEHDGVLTKCTPGSPKIISQMEKEYEDNIFLSFEKGNIEERNWSPSCYDSSEVPSEDESKLTCHEIQSLKNSIQIW